MNGRFKNYLVYVVAYVALFWNMLFGNIFSNATIYGSVSMGTPYVKGDIELENDYK